MTLSFSTKWPKSMGELAGQPNYFVEKIHAGLNLYFTGCQNNFDGEEEWDGGFWDDNVKDKLFSWKGTYHVEPKLHTIREDKNDRWRAGMDVHFVTNSRTKNRFQFAPVVKCVSTQKIEVVYTPIFNQYGRHTLPPLVMVDGNPLIKPEVEKLAINDGFDSVEDFFAYFNKDFKEKLIHWTDLRY